MLQRPHFLPKVSPRSVAQTAHCVRIILYMGKSLGAASTRQRERRASGRKTLALDGTRRAAASYMRVVALDVDSERFTSTANRRASAAPREGAVGSHHHTAPMA